MTTSSSNIKTMILVLALALVFALATASPDLTVSTTTAASTATAAPDTLLSTQQYEAQHTSSTSIQSPQHDESHLSSSDLEEVRLRKYDAQFAAFIKEQELIQQQRNQLSLQRRDLKEENGK